MKKVKTLTAVLGLSAAFLAACGGDNTEGNNGAENGADTNNTEVNEDADSEGNEPDAEGASDNVEDPEAEDADPDADGEDPAADGEGEGEAGDDETSMDDAMGGDQEMPEPDLEDIPDVVAEVNSEEITAEEFETAYEGQFMQMAQQSMMMGQEVDQDQLKQQVADTLIGTELLVQEAENRDLEASEEDIQNTLDELAEQSGLESGDELVNAIVEQGTPEEEVMNQVEMQVKIDKLIEEASGDIEVTDEEVEQQYEELVAQQEAMMEEQGGEAPEGSEIPELDEIRGDLEEQIRGQKESEATQELVEQLREEGDVTVNI
ncbi:SurA N-terminal domain-containing protein [Alkalicoccus urumqiensis]|nr:SurA N-terminal domain-containing protein [Alkalicoccus urumqiensis]